MVRCKQCQYPLKGLTEHRCPECAHPFDPNDPETFATVIEPAPKRPLLWALFVVYIISTVILVLFVLPAGYDPTCGACGATLLLAIPLTLLNNYLHRCKYSNN